MRLLEKVLVTIFIIILCLQLFPFPGSAALFLACSWLLSGAYFIGGYWLFKRGDSKENPLSIIAGIAFGLAIFTVPYSAWMRKDTLYIVMPAVNILLFMFLLAYLFIKRKDYPMETNKVQLLIRSVVILVITCFFSYSPMSFKPYREVLKAFNQRSEHLTVNILMFDYTYLYEDAINSQNCEGAIQYAEHAVMLGRQWLGSDTVGMDNDISGIAGTYENLIEAYQCKAEKESDLSNYSVALNYFMEAESLLNSNKYFDDWASKKCWILNDIGNAYYGLKDWEKASFYYSKAIERHGKIKINVQKGLARLYSNLAKVKYRQKYYDESNLLFRKANYQLKDSVQQRSKHDLNENNLGIGKNLLLLDRIPKASDVLNKALLNSKQSAEYYGELCLYYGIASFRLNEFKKSDSLLKKALDTFEKEKNISGIVGTYQILAHLAFTLSDYNKTQQYLTKGIHLVERNAGKDAKDLRSFKILQGKLDHTLGKYRDAKSNFENIYNSLKYNSSSDDIEEVLTYLAEVNLDLGEFSEARQNIDTAFHIVKDFHSVTIRSSSFYNTIAYVNYALGKKEFADSLYNEVIKVNAENPNTLSVSDGLNGLGLLSMSSKKYEKADSLFNKALAINLSLLGSENSSYATILLNLSHLKFYMEDFKGSKQLLSKSEIINKKFLDKSHDFFADVYFLRGEILLKERSKTLAKENFQKALEIYEGKFGSTHPKTVAVKRKLKSLKK
ncbi:MAG TPA: hypothetical protein VD908_18550 [Cytophagales bacterium]|nr:hypothetical protein [Cytophagales bacterium]